MNKYPSNLCGFCGTSGHMSDTCKSIAKSLDKPIGYVNPHVLEKLQQGRLSTCFIHPTSFNTEYPGMSVAAVPVYANPPVQAKALTDDGAEAIAVEAFMHAVNGGHRHELYKLPQRSQLRALLASQPQVDMATCNHIFIAVPIGDPYAVNALQKAVCVHCGYEPKPQTNGSDQ